MPIGHKEIDLCGSTGTHILQDTQPPFFAFFGTGSQSQYLLVAFQINAQDRQDDARIALLAMPDWEMNAIKVHNTVGQLDRKSTRLNSSHQILPYSAFSF